MKNSMLIIPCFLLLSLGLGCDTKKLVSNRQESSKEEALYKSSSYLENFDKHVFYLSVSSVMEDYIAIVESKPITPRVAESSDISLKGKEFAHIVINKDKDGKLWLIFLTDTRPPEIVFKKKLN